MPIEIVPLTPELRPALRRFAERVWTRPRTPAFFRWRYEDPDFHLAFLALRDGEVLAMESAFRRPWRVGDEVVDFLEVFDWYCLPELRNTGLGVRVMQRLMKEPHPLLLVGGTADTQGLLPRLQWKVVGQVKRYVRVIGTDTVARALARRTRMPLTLARAVGPAARLVLAPRPQRRAAPRGGRVLAVALPGEELFALERGPSGYRTRPLWTPELLRWLVAGFAGIGRFVPAYFTVDGALRGFGLLRIHDSGPDGCEAEIVDAFTPDPSPDLYDWIVAELTAVADGFGAQRIAASTTCEVLGEALRRNRFSAEAGSNPVQIFWPARAGEGDAGGLPEPRMIAANTNDTPVLPLLAHWWEVP